MILGEGLDKLFARHQRLAAACRQGRFRAWGLEVQCADVCRLLAGNLTGVMMPAASMPMRSASFIYEKIRHVASARGGKVRGAMFRIGPISAKANDLTLMATLSGCEMGLKLRRRALAAAVWSRRWSNLSST